ncbi:hypothetical protein ABIB37_002348 [Agrococcus sp. UYP10]|uniref:hypothetical protein n=1 Tax=Agrococcus sp. UYP10 TaxID=1756355 RepID=UPI0033984135
MPPDRPLPPLRPAAVAYEEGRAGRQQLGLAVAGALFVGVTAFGVWTVVASQQQYPGRPEAVLGTGFGALFALLGAAVALTALGVLRRIRRWARSPRPLLLLDDAGIAGAEGERVAWQQVASIEVRADGPTPPPTNRVAQLDPGHRMAVAVRGGLDRTAGRSSGLRDGRRSVRVLLHDGSDRWHDLTLPVGPERFASVALAIAEHAQHRGVPVALPR